MPVQASAKENEDFDCLILGKGSMMHLCQKPLLLPIYLLLLAGSRSCMICLLHWSRARLLALSGRPGQAKPLLSAAFIGRQSYKGQLSVLGLPAGSPRLRSQLSYMTQERSVYPDLSTVENVTYFATMFGLKRSSLKTETERVMTAVDLLPQRKQLYRDLSADKNNGCHWL